MRIAICEDNEAMKNKLQEIVKDWATVRKLDADVMCFPSAESFLIIWPEVAFDLAFLDIEMKNTTGVDLAKIIRKSDKNMQIVFVTSFTHYALKGYDVNALHYLIKPASPAKILPILDKACAIWKATQDSFILVPDDTGQRKLSLGDVLYITIQSHTAELHTRDNVYEMRKTLDEFMNILPDNFIKIHRSYIVNLYKIDCIFKDSLVVSNEKKLPISRKNAKEVSDAFTRLHTMR